MTDPEERGSSTREDGIALCLSGGGFRAALFHLGAARRLHELGVLQQVRAISSVSGGSIFSAFLATRLQELGRTLDQGFEDWQREIADPFRAFCHRDFRTLPILTHVLWNWIWPRPLSRHLEHRYHDRLTKLKLRDLPPAPEFILCSTDLTFGVNWEFRRDGTHDYQAGHLPAAAEWPLARAVSASASFPPLFGPVVVRQRPEEYHGGSYRGPAQDRLRRKIQLSDGGVYDNMGTEPVWKRWTTVLISDCGAPFDYPPGTHRFRTLLRYTGVVMNQTHALRLKLFFSDTAEGPGQRYSGAYWALASGIDDDATGSASFAGYSKELAGEVIAKIRTDLDSFSAGEMNVLENHGYHVADRSIARRLDPALLPGAPRPPVTPYPAWTDEGRVRKELRDSAWRVSPRRILRTMGVIDDPR